MKPVFQTKFGDKHGNCMVACVASLLELPLSAVPEFGFDQKQWQINLLAFLRQYGLGWQCINYDFYENHPYLAPHGYVILTGPNAQGVNHAVVGVSDEHGIRMVHNPNPNCSGLTKIISVDLITVAQPHLVASLHGVKA